MSTSNYKQIHYAKQLQKSWCGTPVISRLAFKRIKFLVILLISGRLFAKVEFGPVWAGLWHKNAGHTQKHQIAVSFQHSLNVKEQQWKKK